MACDCEFEPKLQLGCVSEIVSSIRAGKLIEDRAILLQHAGCVLGSLGASMSQGTLATQVSSLPLTLEEAADWVHRELSAMPAVSESDDKPSGQAINPALIVLVMRLIQLMLGRFL